MKFIVLLYPPQNSSIFLNFPIALSEKQCIMSYSKNKNNFGPPMNQTPRRIKG